LESEGWEVASTSGGAHLKRTLEMYHELGFETYLEEVKPEECNDCTACFGTGDEIAYRIYTRSSANSIE
jgi:hypothetical protein